MDKLAPMRIIIATDGSTFSAAAAEECARLFATTAGHTFTIVSVYEPPIPMPAEPFAISTVQYQELTAIAREQAAAAAQDAIELLQDRMGDPSMEILTVVELGRPAEIIIETANKWKADLIVVGSHGRSFWGRIALGSVSDAVTHHAPCSVLIVRKRNTSDNF